MSCNAQGFLLNVGITAAQLYNASLCLNYLAIVKYHKTADYIKCKIEPWLHGFSVLYPLVVSIFAILKGVIKPIGAICFISFEYRPPHCVGYKDGEIPDGYEIPCGSGGEKSTRVIILLTAIMSVITIGVILISMALIYCAVRSNEKKMERSGTSALKLRVQERNYLSMTHLQSAPGVSDVNGDCEQGLSGDSANKTPSKKPPFLSSLRASIMLRNHRARIKNSTKSRAILERALAYTLAWFVTYTPRFVYLIWRFAGGIPPLGVAITATFLTPLQGFFNFLVFIYPRLRAAKRSSGSDVSWWKAFLMALTSRETSEIKDKRKRSSLMTSQHLRRRTKKSKRFQKVTDSEEEEKAKEKSPVSDYQRRRPTKFINDPANIKSIQRGIDDIGDGKLSHGLYSAEKICKELAEEEIDLENSKDRDERHEENCIDDIH